MEFDAARSANAGSAFGERRPTNRISAAERNSNQVRNIFRVVDVKIAFLIIGTG